MYTKNAVHRLSREGSSRLINIAASGKVRSPRLKSTADRICVQGDVELVAPWVLTRIVPKAAAAPSCRRSQGRSDHWIEKVSTLAIALVSPGEAARISSFNSGTRIPVFAPGALGTFATVFR